MSEVKTCRTCAHRQGGLTFGKCARSGYYCSTERTYPSRCGVDFQGWESRSKLPFRWSWWHAALGALLFLTLGRACAQPNWRILVDRDSLAIGPLNDVRKWAGLRMAKNETARQCAWELAQRGKELSSLYAERSRCDKAQEDARLLIASHAARIEELSDHNRKLSRKVKRRTPFVPLLVGIVGGFVIHEQLGK